MADKKIYSIVINGVKESTDAVLALNKQLETLEQRIKALEVKSIKINTSGNGSARGTSTNSLTEEERLLKNIESTEAKIQTYSKKIYQNYLAAKDVLKETLDDQKQIAASERLQANNYSYTMKGLKDKLADIKNVMQTTDIGSDLFKKYTKEANEITQKLKELEQAYGNFGRNVGNYGSTSDEFKKIKVAVGDTVREYDNYKKAIKELKQERFQLSQDVGKEADAYKNVDNAIKELESDYKDLDKSSAFMDNMLDTMQSFTAIASIGMGLSTLFELDDSKFNETMQKLTSLLVVLKGIETLQLQMQSKDGWLGKFFGFGNDALNKAFGKLESSLTNLALRFGYVTKAANGTYKVIAKYPALIGLVQGAVDTFRVALLALKTVVFSIFLVAAPAIIDFIGNFIKSLNSSKIAAQQAEEELNALTRALDSRRDALGASYLKGEIKDEEYLKQLYDSQTEALIKQIDAIQMRAKTLDKSLGDSQLQQFVNAFTATQNTEFTGQKFNGNATVGYGRLGMLFNPYGNDIEVTVKSIKEVENAWKQCNEAIREGKDYFDKWGNGLNDWVSSLFVTVKDTEEVMRGMGNIRLSDLVGRFQDVNKQFKDGKIDAEQYAAELAKLRTEMNSSDILNSVIANLDKYIPDEKVREAVESIINEIMRLDDAFNMTSEGQIHYWNQVRIDAMKNGLKKTLEQIKENERHEIAEQGKTQEQINLIHDKYERQRLDAQEKANKEALEKNKAANKKFVDAENELIALRIENMKEGLAKRLAQLDNERRLALQKVRDNGVKVGELSLEINKKYDRLIIEEKRKWAFDVLKIYEDLANRINQVNRGTFEKEVSTASQSIQSKSNSQKQNVGYNMITPTNFDDSKNLEEYYKKVLDIQINAANNEAQIQQERLDKNLEFNKQEEELRHNRLINLDGGEYIQQLRAGKITQEQYDKLIEDEKLAHNARMNALDKEYAVQSSGITENNLKSIQSQYNNYFSSIVSNVRNDKSKIDEIISKQPVTDKSGWGVVNIGKSNANYKKALEDYDKLKNDIIQKQAELDAALKAKTISPEDFAMRQSELKNEIKAIDQAVEDVKESQSMLIANFMQSIQKYIQAGIQSFQDIMSAVWDAQDVAFDKEQEQLDKWNDELDDKLDKQQEIIEQHKSAIDSIEDELATSRGDRRQHLIDQLNAEIEAQRAAQAEEQRIQKEKERAEKKQEDLELKRKKAEYKRNLTQAIVNGAMAVTMAAINKWPVPAIPMMALAASTTAAQIAIMASNKPYAKGGQLEGGVAVGARHRDGGIPVLGGRASIEGGEFITNRQTTANNVDLLEYINAKHRKLNIDDFITFYSKGAKKNIISMSPKTKFADGGQIPTLNNEYQFDDRLLTAFEDYSNRPVYVSVVDINKKQNDVKNIQVLAGLNE